MSVEMIENLGVEIPDAPNLGSFASQLKGGMAAHPEQAAQILTSIAAVRDASAANYDTYCALCAQLDIEPEPEEVYDQHDPKVFRPLVRASLKKNLALIGDVPDDVLASFDSLFDTALQEKNRSAFIRKAVEAILKLLGSASQEQIAGYSKLALAGMTFLRR